MNTEISELIQKNKTYYTLSFITLIFAFIFLNISVLSIYNLSQNNKSLRQNYNMNIYINNNVSQNSIENIEKDILNLEGVENINYIDKKMALQNLIKKLGISSNSLKNPLLNSFTVYADSETNLSNAKLVIEETKGIKEVVINEKNVVILNEKISRNSNIMMWLFFIIIIPIQIMIFNIMHSTVVSQNHDIEAKLYLGLDKKEILRPYYFINNIKFISAGIIGSLIFLNLYEFIRNSISEDMYLVPLLKVGEITTIMIVILSIVFPFISQNIIKVKR